MRLRALAGEGDKFEDQRKHDAGIEEESLHQRWSPVGLNCDGRPRERPPNRREQAALFDIDSIVQVDGEPRQSLSQLARLRIGEMLSAGISHRAYQRSQPGVVCANLPRRFSRETTLAAPAKAVAGCLQDPDDEIGISSITAEILATSLLSSGDSGLRPRRKPASAASSM